MRRIEKIGKERVPSNEKREKENRKETKSERVHIRKKKRENEWNKQSKVNNGHLMESKEESV